tara:strand:- start:10673 stop:11926 length:1254 start_codon:yes stop_codon:yes gene_type:complete
MNLSNYRTEFDKILNRDYITDVVRPMRKDAFENFFKTGFPTQKWENWQYTNLSTLVTEPFRLSEIPDAPKFSPEINPYEIENINTIVIYNGHYQKAISTVPDGVQLLSSLDYFEKNSNEVESLEDSPFDHLNTAFMDSGVSFVISQDTNVKIPVRILFISNGEESIMSNPRIYLDMGDSSSFTFIEHHVGDAASFFQNASFFASIGVNASLDHIRIQSNSTTTQNMGNLKIKQETDSQYAFTQFTDGSKMGRTNINVHLNGQGANCALNGLALSHGKQHLSNYIIVEHKVPHCTSSQLFKSVLREKSSGTFNGRTIVQKNAQKTDASQSNKNLLLSKDALMNSNPQLEIHADDVRCTHGSTTGELDADSLFYLRSRGLDLRMAKSLLVRGFATECFDTIQNEKVRSFIMKRFNNWLN